MGLRETNQCPECQETDYSEHEVFNRHNINTLWTDVKQFILTQTNIQIENKRTDNTFWSHTERSKRKRDKEQN